MKFTTSSGNWSNNSTWESEAPSDGDSVTVTEGTTLSIDVETPRIDRIVVEGTLTMADGSHCRVDTIETRAGSSIELGTASNPLEAEVTFIDTGPIEDSERKDRGLIGHGAVDIHGRPKTPWTTLSAHATADDTKIELSESPNNWSQGDRLALPGFNPDDSETEERFVASVDGTTVTLDEPLSHDHVPPRPNLDSYVLNLTRSVVFRSESTDELRRGHVMIMGEGSDIRFMQFDDLGRTNKDRPITNPVRGRETLPDQDDPNPAARYPLHWHKVGIDASEPHVVEGVVVDGSPGWGIVNHHAYAEVTDSITYGVRGAGFVAEGGNERGSFKRNFALESEGSGEVIDSRAHGAHGGDPAIDDFGHAGHGFWLQSPLVEVVDNVASGHRHQAFVWWLRPLLEGPMAECSEVEDSRVTFCPNLPVEYIDQDRHAPLLEAIDQGRFSNDKDSLMRDTGKIPSTFALLKNVAGNETFASGGGVDFSRHNFKWKHERFSDFSTIEDMTVHSIGTFVDADGNEHSPDLPRHRASGHQGRGGNVGVSFRYTSNVTLRDSTILGTGRDHSVGIPFHDYLWTRVIDNCTISGWDWGVDTGEHRLDWVKNNVFTDNSVDVNWWMDNVGPGVLDNNDLAHIRYTFEYQNQKAADVFDTDQSNGVRVNGRTAHYEASDPSYVPFPDQDALGGINNLDDVFDDPSALVGMSNADIMSQYGTAIGGHLLPDDAVEENFMFGSLLDPKEGRDPPTAAHLDSVNADSYGGFSVVSANDVVGGKCLEWDGGNAPKDDPATISFDCASGVYEVYFRARPNAWNGDDIYVRFDGGEWHTAEKLKSPIGFAWHGAAPNNGEPYQFTLSEGEHTLEFASDSSVKIDEIAVTSDASVIGAYGLSSESDGSEPTPSQEPYTDHDLSRIQAEDFDIGGEGVAYHDTSSGNKGGAYRDTDVDIEETADDTGKYNVGWIRPDEWLEYTIDVPSSGSYQLLARVAGKNDTSFDISADGSKLATVDVPNTGGWQNWTTVNAGTVDLSNGRQVVRFEANGGDFNLNWFGFVQPKPDPPTNLTVVDVTPSSVSLSWDAVTEADSYRVYRDGSQIQEVDASSTQTSVGGLGEQTTYSFYVTTISQGYESEPSNTVEATTTAAITFENKVTWEYPPDANSTSTLIVADDEQSLREAIDYFQEHDSQ